MLLAGVDISTRAIHAALIPIDHDAAGVPPVTFRTATLEQTKGADPLYRRVERARHMREALRPLFAPVASSTTTACDVLLAYIEEPRGRFRNDALTGTFDSVCTAIPTGIVVSGIQPMSWRQELGLPRTIKKAAAIELAIGWLHDKAFYPSGGIDEHIAESLLIALAGRQINDRHFRSAA